MTKNDRYLVLATDGLWDELKPKDVAKLIQENDNDKEKIIDNIFKSAILHAALESNVTYEQLLKMEPGRKKDQCTMI